MIAMNAFYANLFTTETPVEPIFASLLRVAQANLKDVLAVRSQLAWDSWN